MDLMHIHSKQSLKNTIKLSNELNNKQHKNKNSKSSL